MKLYPITSTTIYRLLGDNNQIAVSSVRVSVRDGLGVLKNLFRDRDGLQTQTNPFTADASGQWSVYTDASELAITLSKNNANALIRFSLTNEPKLVKGTTNPNNNLLPDFEGQEFYNTANQTLWKALDLTNSNWVQIQLVTS